MTTISRPTPADRAEWDALWQAYITFYESEVPAHVTDSTFARILDAVFLLIGLLVMIQFVRFAHRIEPFTE